MDLLEIEIKSYCDSHKDVVERLEALGAVFTETVREEDLYFNHPQKDFRETDEVLRIRRVRSKSLLTYKGPKMDSRTKTRVEVEVEVGDYDTMKKVLKLLGYIESGSVSKVRKKYCFNDIEICLDSVEGLGDFVELEKRDTDRGMAEDELFSLAGELGLDRFETKSYLELKSIS